MILPQYLTNKHNAIHILRFKKVITEITFNDNIYYTFKLIRILNNSKNKKWDFIIYILFFLNNKEYT